MSVSARPYASRAEIEAAVSRLGPGHLIGIDGLPLSGKSTLADHLCAIFGLTSLALDDFVRPERDWPSHATPGFPFAYIRYDDFLTAVRDLAQTGSCSFHPFDWQSLDMASELRHVEATRPVIVEGVSALHPELAGLYALGIFVDSDRDSLIDAAFARGVGSWGKEWRELFVPSADLYMASGPETRADLIVAGRGRNLAPGD